MPNPKQSPLFGDLADIDQARGFKTKDEIEFERERRRNSKGKHTQMPKAPGTGPACLRCLRWQRPTPGGEYGICRQLVRVGSPYPRLDVETGTVIHLNEADRLGIDDWEYLRTGEAFACSAFADEADAGPEEVRTPAPVTRLSDRVRKAS